MLHIIFFLSYALSGKRGVFLLAFFFPADNLLPDAYLHFHSLISLLYFGVSKSAKQYLSCSNHCQLCILFDFIVADVLQYLSCGPHAIVLHFLEPMLRKHLHKTNRQEKNKVSKQVHQIIAQTSK